MLKSVRDNRTLALNWVFNKRQYSISRHWGDLIYPLHNSNKRNYVQVDLFGNCIDSLYLTSFCGGFSVDGWSVSISVKELRQIKSLSTYREYNLSTANVQYVEYHLKIANKYLGYQMEVRISLLRTGPAH